MYRMWVTPLPPPKEAAKASRGCLVISAHISTFLLDWGGQEAPEDPAEGVSAPKHTSYLSPQISHLLRAGSHPPEEYLSQNVISLRSGLGSLTHTSKGWGVWEVQTKAFAWVVSSISHARGWPPSPLNVFPGVLLLTRCCSSFHLPMIIAALSSFTLNHFDYTLNEGSCLFTLSRKYCFLFSL